MEATGNIETLLYRDGYLWHVISDFCRFFQRVMNEKPTRSVPKSYVLSTSSGNNLCLFAQNRNKRINVFMASSAVARSLNKPTHGNIRCTIRDKNVVSCLIRLSAKLYEVLANSCTILVIVVQSFWMLRQNRNRYTAYEA